MHTGTAHEWRLYHLASYVLFKTQPCIAIAIYRSLIMHVQYDIIDLATYTFCASTQL